MAAVVALCALLVVLWAVGRWGSPAAGAERIRAHLQALYAADHELIEVTAANFSHLDLAFYDDTMKTLAEHGFRALGDIEDRTLSRLGTSRPTFLRIATNGDSIGSAIYHLRLSGLLRWLARQSKDARIVDFETEFSDGRFLTTTNAWRSRHMAVPEAMMRAVHPQDTPPLALLADHRAGVSRYLEAHPNVKPVASVALADTLATWHRANRIKAEFHASRQHWITRQELAGIAADRPSAARQQAASDIADVMEGRRADAAPRPRQSTGWLTFWWLLLVLAFTLCYRWAAQ